MLLTRPSCALCVLVSSAALSLSLSELDELESDVLVVLMSLGFTWWAREEQMFSSINDLYFVMLLSVYKRNVEIAVEISQLVIFVLQKHKRPTLKYPRYICVRVCFRCTASTTFLLTVRSWGCWCDWSVSSSCWRCFCCRVCFGVFTTCR